MIETKIAADVVADGMSVINSAISVEKQGMIFPNPLFEVLNKRFPDPRILSSVDRIRYAHAYATVQEKAGFSTFYWTQDPTYGHYNGATYSVLKRCIQRDPGAENYVLWKIQFDDRNEIFAYPKEICPGEMLANDCPPKYCTLRTPLFTGKVAEDDINTVFAAYERLGFSETFRDFWKENKGWDDSPFDVIRRATIEEMISIDPDLNLFPAWLICMRYGQEYFAYPEEICNPKVLSL